MYVVICEMIQVSLCQQLLKYFLNNGSEKPIEPQLSLRSVVTSPPSDNPHIVFIALFFTLLPQQN